MQRQDVSHHIRYERCEQSLEEWGLESSREIYRHVGAHCPTSVGWARALAHQRKLVQMSQMELGAPQDKHKGPGQHRMGLALERFASAKKTAYNRQEKRDKQFALNAKRVNQYRKLKRRLQQSAAQPQV